MQPDEDAQLLFGTDFVVVSVNDVGDICNVI